MKYIILVPDGMADYPIRQLSWKTPLMAANAPVIKSLGRGGQMGIFKSLPKGTQAGSDVANMSIMGYDPVSQLTGRGALESAAMDIKLADDEIAFRCNLITVKGDTIRDYSAGYIPTDESSQLILSLKDEFDDDMITFHPGNSFRNILVLGGEGVSDHLGTTPPHDIVGQNFNPYLPSALDHSSEMVGKLLRDLMAKTRKVLDKHEVNIGRELGGKNPGNMIWPWSPGYRLDIRPFSEIWGIDGAAVSAVDTVKGLAKSACMEAPDVPGATGFTDTDYEAKANAALDLLRRVDLVYVHVEAIDEMGHSGNVKGKIGAIQDYDSRLASNLIHGLESRGYDYRLAVIPDHYTPCSIRTHVRDPTPFVIAQSGRGSEGSEYNEESAKSGELGILRGDSFLRTLIGS
jgi:2,3-bisphosphoglycerate-independent phosphoglycerate mutase